MRRIQIVVLFTACLFLVASTVTAQKAKEVMTNAKVVEMVKGGVPESTIVLAIQQSEPNFDTSSTALIELSKQGVGQRILDAMFSPPATKNEPPKRTEPANAIAWKDMGSLRVVLKSVLPITIDNGRIGMRCSLEFVNLETQKPIVVAMNTHASHEFYGALGSYLRSTLVDENGGVWWLKNSDVAGGIGKVGVGLKVWGTYYDPAEIVIVLAKRDDLKADVINTGSQQVTFIYGSMTEMSPGQTIPVTMTFAPDRNRANSDTQSRVFQMATEIVVGSLTSGSKKSYTLYNLTFDRVSPK